LLELMVVLVIIGIVLTTVMLSFAGDSRAEEMQREAQRVMALLRLGSDEAVLRSEQLAVRFGETEYEFMIWRDGKWRELVNDPELRLRTLPPGMELNLDLQDNPPPTLVTEDSDLPQVFLLSSGEMTPFTLTFSAPQTERRFSVTATLLGRLELE
jgi:general secretion pathway protein H